MCPATMWITATSPSGTAKNEMKNSFNAAKARSPLLSLIQSADGISAGLLEG